MIAAANQPKSVLAIRDLFGGYGEGQVLQGVSLDLREGEVATLLGRNGAGKTTTLRAIVGMLHKRRGSIMVNGTETIGMPLRKIARLGLGYVPEERGIFATLNVKENLLLPPVVAPGGLTEEEIFELFPNLQERLASKGTKLSGGEQQMLAIARVLRTGARVLLLDEPTEGLAPVIVQQIGRTIRRLKERGFSILLVEQNVNFAATIADRHYLYEEGRVIDTMSNDEIRSDMGRLREHVGV